MSQCNFHSCNKLCKTSLAVRANVLLYNSLQLSPEKRLLKLFFFNFKKKSFRDLNMRGIAAVFVFRHYQDFVPVANTVWVEGPAAAFQLLGAQDGAHLTVDVKKPDPVVGELQQSSEFFLKVAHRLLQVKTDRFHSIAPANVHHCASRAQIHIGQRGQVTISGHKDMVPGRNGGLYRFEKKNRNIFHLNAFWWQKNK